MPILVITHRPSLCGPLQEQLIAEGYTIHMAKDGLSALQQMMQNRYDTIILDWKLGEISGLSVLRELRIRGIDAPVLVLYAGLSTDEKILALDSGADDVLTMPYHPEELYARLRRMQRIGTDTGAALAPKVYCVADLTVDCEKQLVTRGGRRLMLSQKEYAILECLIRHQGQPLTAAQIEEGIAGHSASGGVVSVYIHYLRRKIDHGCSVKLLHTVRKGGYMIKAVQSNRYL